MMNCTRGLSRSELTESLAHSWLRTANGSYTVHLLPSVLVAAGSLETFLGHRMGRGDTSCFPSPGQILVTIELEC